MIKNVTLDNIISIINENIENNISIEQINDDLSKLGMDSIAFIRIIVALEEAFEIEILDEYLIITEMNTLNKIMHIVTLMMAND